MVSILSDPEHGRKLPLVNTIFSSLQLKHHYTANKSNQIGSQKRMTLTAWYLPSNLSSSQVSMRFEEKRPCRIVSEKS